jgi:hypothetical protein
MQDGAGLGAKLTCRILQRAKRREGAEKMREEALGLRHIAVVMILGAVPQTRDIKQTTQDMGKAETPAETQAVVLGILCRCRELCDFHIFPIKVTESEDFPRQMHFSN